MKTTVIANELLRLKKELEEVMSYPIPGDSKLYLNDLYEEVLIKIGDVINEKENLIKKFGKEIDGEYQITDTIETDGKTYANPGYFEYLDNEKLVDAIQFSFAHPVFKPEILKDVRSESKFPILYRFFNHGFFI